MDTDTPYTDRQPRPKWGPTTKAIVAVLLLVLAAIAFYALRVVLAPLIIGTLMAVIFYPAAHRVSRWTRLPHGLATILVYLILFVLVIPVGLLVAPQIADRIRVAQTQFLAIVQDLESLSADTVKVLGFTFAVRDVLGDITSSLTGTVTRAATSSIGFLMGAARMGFLAVVTLVIGLYLTRDGKKIVCRFPNADRRPCAGKGRAVVLPDLRVGVSGEAVTAAGYIQVAIIIQIRQAQRADNAGSDAAHSVRTPCPGKGAAVVLPDIQVAGSR